jgi:hypothetical protein
MFKSLEPSAMNAKHFGVGSLIEAGHSKFLVVGIHTNTVAVIDLTTFKQVGDAMGVSDINYLFANEARSLVDKTVGNYLNFTYTDFDLNAKGMKNV